MIEESSLELDWTWFEGTPKIEESSLVALRNYEIELTEPSLRNRIQPLGSIPTVRMVGSVIGRLDGLVLLSSLG